MQPWLAEGCARLILATKFIDKSYRAIDRARSALVLALASDAVLARFNCLAYGNIEAYHPDSSAFRRHLYPWEEKVVAQYFPPPPARVLIGGAGGGREVLALAERGYEVVAFEPSAPLAAAMASRVAAKGLNVRVYRGGYEDMPLFFPAGPEGPCGSLEAESRFKAAILGWASYSHLRTEEQRIRTLSSFARYVRGAILVSFYRFAAGEMHPKGAWTGRLRRLLKIQAGDQFSIDIGFTHDEVATELAAVADRSGLTIVHQNDGSRDTNWAHAVLCPVDLAGARGSS